MHLLPPATAAVFSRLALCPTRSHHTQPPHLPASAVELERAAAGDIVSLAGVAAAGVADTVAAPDVAQALPPGARLRQAAARRRRGVARGAGAGALRTLCSYRAP